LYSRKNQTFLFKLTKIDDQKDNRPIEDNILLTFKEINKEVVFDKVQQWLDDKGIELDICEINGI